MVFQKGQNFWLGKHHTEATKIKLSNANKGKHSSPNTEFKKGHHLGKGIPKSKAQILKMSLRMRGKPAWNKGKRTPETILKKLRRPHPWAIGKPSGNLGKPWSEEMKSKRSELYKKKWKNLGFARYMSAAWGRKYNNDEKYLDAILQLNFPHEWRYVGDGEVWIVGKNPDFVNCNGKKLIIEYDHTHWHTKNPHDAERNEIYEKYGFRTLSVNEHDLNNIDSLIKKIESFKLSSSNSAAVSDR